MIVFEVAGEHVTPRVPMADPVHPIDRVRMDLIGRRFDTVAAIAVCQQGELIGLVSIEDLLAAPGNLPISHIMMSAPPAVAPGVDQEVAAWKAVSNGESTLAVVDAGRRFVGLIPPHRLLEVLLHEHDEDIARLGGFLRGNSRARSASEEPVLRRLWHRFPWLLLGLLGAVLSADIVALFQPQLEANVILAFFLPGVVYLADAVGTQTETLVIRGLSVGIPIGRIMVRELATGLGVGIVLCGIIFPVVWIRWGRIDVAIAVSFSVLGACSIASATAMALPWIFDRFGKDPAFGSGPLATVIQDLLSVVIYFAVCFGLVQ